MAHTGGPTSMLPGELMFLPPNTKCDNHESEFAVVRIVGEVDSFGYEASDLCVACYEKAKNHKPEPSACDLCGTTANLSSTRDPDEGTSGPVYYACAECRTDLVRHRY